MSENEKDDLPEFAGVLGDPDADGKRSVLYERDGQLSQGTIEPLREGMPLAEDGEIVEVRANGNVAILKSHGRVGRATSQGPAVVNSPKFKSNWDNIFGKSNKNNLN